MVSTVSMVSSKTKFEEVPLDRGSNWGVVVFEFAMLSLKQREIEHRSLTINH